MRQIRCQRSSQTGCVGLQTSSSSPTDALLGGRQRAAQSHRNRGQFVGFQSNESSTHAFSRATRGAERKFYWSGRRLKSMTGVTDCMHWAQYMRCRGVHCRQALLQALRRRIAGYMYRYKYRPVESRMTGDDAMMADKINERSQGVIHAFFLARSTCTVSP